MDCPSEEQIIRLRLGAVDDISSLTFRIADRQLIVIHKAPIDAIIKALNSLKLGVGLMDSTPEKTPTSEADRQDQRLLIIVLLINLFFFGLEAATGFFAQSMGLIADSLDMLADVIVYGLSLVVIGRSQLNKNRVARASGYLQMFLALLGFIEVVKRFLGYGEMPLFHIMILISFLALLGNAVSMYLLQKRQSSEVHMQASVLFTSTDVIANIGVILAGILVFVTGSPIPDLVIGTVVFLLVGRGAWRILKLAQ